MGLQNDILTSLAEAFDTDLYDAVQPFTLAKGEVNYDPNTGNIILGQVDSGVWRGVFSKANKRYIQDGAELPVDTRVVCLANEPPFPPDVNDTVVTNISSDTYAANQNCFLILRVDLDPSFSVYTLYCQSATHGPIQRRQFV